MRGRVDKSRGLITSEFVPNVGRGANLIQKAEYNQAIIKAFRIVERSPSPTFGDVVHPVCIIEDLREQITPTYRRTIAGGRAPAAVAPNSAFIYVRNAGTNPNDRVVVEHLTYKADAGITLFFFPNVLMADFGLTPALEVGSRIAAPGTLANFATSGFVTALSGFSPEQINTALIAAVTGAITTRADNQDSIFHGPFVLLPDHVCLLMHAVAGVATQFYAQFYCTEVPGA